MERYGWLQNQQSIQILKCMDLANLYILLVGSCFAPPCPCRCDNDWQNQLSLINLSLHFTCLFSIYCACSCQECHKQKFLPIHISLSIDWASFILLFGFLGAWSHKLWAKIEKEILSTQKIIIFVRAFFVHSLWSRLMIRLFFRNRNLLAHLHPHCVRSYIQYSISERVSFYLFDWPATLNTKASPPQRIIDVFTTKLCSSFICIMMAKRLGKDNSSQDWNNYVNIGSSPSLCLPHRSKRLISPTVMTLLSTFIFSTVLVHSFSLHSTSSKRRQFRPISFTSSFNHQQPMNIRLGAITDDSIEEGGSIDNNDFASPTTPDTPTEAIITSGVSDDGLGAYDPSENLPETKRDVPNVGDPQLRVKEKDWSVTSILKELAAIQQQGPQKYCILGTRHCSYLHQQIIELLYVLDCQD